MISALPRKTLHISTLHVPEELHRHVRIMTNTSEALKDGEILRCLYVDPIFPKSSNYRAPTCSQSSLMPACASFRNRPRSTDFEVRILQHVVDRLQVSMISSLVQ